jgi:hypothetical protein
MSGRPRLYACHQEARSSANRRHRVAMTSAGMVQRSVWLSRASWEAVRSLRRPGETSDAAVLERLIQEASCSA